ncbi:MULTISPECIES: Lrp/AsnC family transcriptional regulator [Lentzea]|uniref:DNA-binding transcriptional regulator, Lrp family n=1 Tax=Lentzea flaviverrucosa TaxID=200379 RepID=A0A1H9XEM3_9PSEU|nr:MULTISPECIES: Lrp/AsnC family transcriptional regulator [Lentzea]MCR3748956.1 DNA-binding transcriptional regulator, Lrp family [Lentzea californiensis]RDI21491.1 AsnC family transcriptional regulator [Lentzea flaviverrucosa]SES44585.1 DNA-binding transcriptional regulator, Lrp family [Lentzea flaviverrucosa]
MDAELDEIDRRILRELEADGRLSGRALAERVTISRANAYARFERLVADGVITGFTARVDPVKVGLTTSAYVAMTVRQNNWRDLQTQLRAIPEVRHMALMGGEFDVMLLVRAEGNNALRRVVLEQLQTIPGVLSTKTFLIFEDADN